VHGDASGVDAGVVSIVYADQDGKGRVWQILVPPETRASFAFPALPEDAAFNRPGSGPIFPGFDEIVDSQLTDYREVGARGFPSEQYGQSWGHRRLFEDSAEELDAKRVSVGAFPTR
jgi:hypothetical protein